MSTPLSALRAAGCTVLVCPALLPVIISVVEVHLVLQFSAGHSHSPAFLVLDCSHDMHCTDIKPSLHSRGSSADAAVSSQQQQQQQQQHHLPLITSQPFPLITSIPAPASLSTSFTSPPTSLGPVSTAPLTLGQVPSLHLSGQGSDGSGGAMGGIMDKDALAKAEIRRARRCAQRCMMAHRPADSAEMCHTQLYCSSQLAIWVVQRQDKHCLC